MDRVISFELLFFLNQFVVSQGTRSISAKEENFEENEQGRHSIPESLLFHICYPLKLMRLEKFALAPEEIIRLTL